MESIKELLWGNIDLDDFESGGNKCLNYMSNNYRLLISFIMIPVYSITFGLIVKYNKLKTKKIITPSLIEMIFGYLAIFVYLLTVYMKGYSKAILFMLNPCHTIGLMQAICLISKNTIFMKYLNNIGCNLLFCCASALFTPNLTGLSNVEVFFFYYEHWEALLLNPIILIAGGRYFDENTFKFKTGVIASCFFGLYQRVVLYPISFLTSVNLNYTLCPSLGDPFLPLVGEWYYFLSDYYLWFIAFMITKLLYIIYKVFQMVKSEKLD